MDENRAEENPRLNLGLVITSKSMRQRLLKV